MSLLHTNYLNPRQLPLIGVDINTVINECFAKVIVIQTYENIYEDNLETSYVFPLHKDAVITDFSVQIGDRILKGIILKKAEAAQRYDQAVHY